MDEGNDLLEDGEIQDSEKMSSVSDQFSLSRVTREPQRICSDESSNDNSDISDDDSDACSKPKRAKPHSPVPVMRNQVPNKYKVWSIALQEEALMENLTKCDVEAIDRERSVESYNYKLVDRTDHSHFRPHSRSDSHYLDDDYVSCNDDDRRYTDDEKKYVIGRKRQHGDVKNRLGYKNRKFHTRRLPNLAVTAEDSAEEVAEDIALKLREKKVHLIMNVVLVLGKQKAIELYNETKGVEDNGGMLLMNGERRRTAGGVYLLLLKRDDSITSDAMKEIFAEDRMRITSKRRMAARKKRKKKTEEIKETLIREKLLNLNTTASVASSESKLQTCDRAESNNLEERELTVTNPPPSPATDQDTPPSRTHAYSEDESEHTRDISQVNNLGRKAITYGDVDDDDDYLDVGLDLDDMDVF